MKRSRPPVTTTTTVVASSSVSAAPLVRGYRLGINAGAGLSDKCVQATKDLGLGWVRFSIECGWSGALTTAQTLINKAHSNGLKVCFPVQLSGHSYSDPARLDALAQFAVDVCHLGVDLLEVGNEWQNAMFWSSPDVNVVPPVAQAQLTLKVAQKVRAAGVTTPMITNGMSPAGGSLNPEVWWPQFVSAAPLAGAGFSGIGLHGFCYPELSTVNAEVYTPMKQIPSIRSAAASVGFPSKVFVTEIGCPGFASAAPVIRGVALDYQRQVDCYEAYFTQFRAYESQGVPFGPTFFATAVDGESATTGVEAGLGLITSAGVRKPVWDHVRAFAAEQVTV